MSNTLDLDQARQNVRPDMGPSSLQMSSDDTNKQRVKEGVVCEKVNSIYKFEDFCVSAGGGRL